MRYLLSLLLVMGGGSPSWAQQSDNGVPLWADRPDAAALTRSTERRIANARRLIHGLLADPGPRTVENTLARYEQALRAVELGYSRAHLAAGLLPDSATRAAGEKGEQAVKRFWAELDLSRPLYDAIGAVDLTKADGETRYWVAKRLRRFRLNGVDQPAAARAAIVALRDSIAALEQTFSRNILEDVDTVDAAAADLDGLPADYVARHPARADGRVALTTAYPDVFPVLSFARSDDLRRRMLFAFNNRAYPANAGVLDSLLAARYRLAQLLGYSTWADVATADKMIETPHNASVFIDRTVAASATAAAHDHAELLARKRRDQPGATAVHPWERTYWAQVVRKEAYAFDAQAVRAYFPYDSVQRGILDLTARIFGVSFRRAPEIPVWHPSVEAWEMVENGQLAGRFYLDMHPRAGKYSHAAVFPGRFGTRDGRMPEGILVANLPGGEAGDPGLMEYGDVRTFLHEFGHLIHALSANRTRWTELSMLQLEWDFIEAPSQMLEEWLWDPATLARFARHYDTGRPIPAELVVRMKRATDFGKGLDVRRQMTFARISLALHDRSPEGLAQDSVVHAVEAAYLPFPPMGDTHFQAGFDHLTGYSAYYYTYMWSSVIAKDLFSGFDPARLLAPGAARAYREKVLAPGSSAPAAQLIQNFLGRPFSFDAWERWMREEPTRAEAEVPVRSPG
jgi:thimet oligopeptidase